MPDTTTRRTTDSVKSGYARPVDDPTDDNPHLIAARGAIRDMDDAAGALEAARDRRDAAIAKLGRQGYRPPAIGRALGMSTTNARNAMVYRRRGR